MAAATTLVLGPVGIVGAEPDREPVILKGNQAAIAALLAVRSPMAVSRSKLVDAVWGEQPPKTAAAALRMDVSRVRQRYHEVGFADAIVSEGDGYRLTLGAPATDLAQLDDRIAVAERAIEAGDPQRALRSLRAAAALWRGEPFANVAVAGDLVVDAAVALERRADCDELLVDVLMATGDLGDAVVVALRNVEQSPYRERRWEQLMVVQARSGRPREALATFQRARRSFGDDLGLDPGPRLVELERRIVSNEVVDLAGRGPQRSISIAPAAVTAKPSRPLGAVVGAHTSTPIGRDDEVADLHAILRRRRLVVVTGFGGIGKSTVAVAVAAGFAGSSVVVPLAGVTRADRVVAAIAAALGVTAGEDDDLFDLVMARLEDGIELLVLDNCEQLAGVLAPVVGRLLADAPMLRILATSRVELPLSGAITFTVGSLATGSAAEPGPAALIAADAALIRPSQLADNWDFVQTICARADGVPLALELLGAASQDGVAPGDASSPGVASAVHVAADALSEVSRRVVDVLWSVPTEIGIDFLGRVLGNGEPQVRRALGAAVRSGLVAERTGRRGSERVRLLEPARDVLAAPIVSTVAVHELADHVLAMTREAVPRFDDQPNHDALVKLDDEHETVLWVLDQLDPARQIELLGRLGVAWSTTGRAADGFHWFAALESALDDVPESLVAGYWLGRVSLRSSMASKVPFVDQLGSARAIALRHGQGDAARRAGFELTLALGWSGRVAEASRLIHELRPEVPLDQPWTALKYSSLEAMSRALGGDVAGAVDDLRDLAGRFRTVGATADVALMCFIGATLAEMAGDRDRLRAVVADGVDVLPGRFPNYSLSALAYTRGRVAVADGNPDAGDLLEHALTLLDTFGEQRTHALCTRELGLWRLANGQPVGATDLARAARRLIRLEPRAAAVAVAHLVAHRRGEGDERTADRLAAFIPVLAEAQGGIPLSAAETTLVASHARHPGHPVDLDELRQLLRSF